MSDIPERAQRWVDMLHTLPTGPLPKHVTSESVGLTTEERRQLFVCVKHAASLSYFPASKFGDLKNVLSSLKNGETVGAGGLLIVGFSGDVAVRLCQRFCETEGVSYDAPFSFSKKGDDHLLEKVIDPVCDRIYAALGGGIRLGHHRMRNRKE